jgi:DNA-binding LacI/PurR family transcriptional regulator
MAQRITITEIAQQAGVTKGTVSKVLNGRADVGEETRKRVMAIVERLDYHPSSAAQSLASRRSNCIGLLLPLDPDHPLDESYWAELIAATVHRAAESNYSIILLSPRRGSDTEPIYEQALRSRQVDGILVIAELLDVRGARKLIESEIPFVTLGQTRSFEHYRVDTDNRESGRMAARHLIKKGVARPAVITGPHGLGYNAERQEGFLSVLGSDCPHAQAKDYRTESIHAAISSLFLGDSNAPAYRPDGLYISAGGNLMFKSLGWLRQNGLLSDQIKLVVNDDYEYLDFFSPAMTAIRQPVEQLGAGGIEMLLSLLEGHPPERPHLLLPGKLVER